MRQSFDTTGARTFAVVRARLPYVDRRALSQAWFSALGLHERDMQRSFAAATVAATARIAGAAPRPATPLQIEAGTPMAASSRPACARDRSERDAPAPGVREASRERVKGAPAPPPDASRRYPPVHAAFRLELDGGRVHLVVRRDGAELHVVALCGEQHVERVKRALALAAEHLRLRGEALTADVRAIVPSGGAA